MRYRLIILIVIGLLVFTSILVFLFGRRPSSTASVNLTFWGLEPPEAWAAILTAYKSRSPSVNVNYVQKSAAGYEKDLLNALASGTGPDVAEINNTWLGKHLAKLSPAATSLISPEIFANEFVDAASADLIRSGHVYAMPFYMDTLALYYNKSFFNNAGLVSSPKTWDDFNRYVKELVQKNDNGEIVRAGAALGTAANVNYAPDILSLIMLQTGTVMTDAATGQAIFDRDANKNGQLYSPGQAALDFYTNFARAASPVYTWNARLPGSLAAFTSGQAAMYMGHASDLGAIQKSGVSFGLASAPQIKDSKKDASYLDVNFGSYRAGAVTLESANKDTAWDFLLFATSQNAASSFLNAARLPTARRDLVEFEASDPVIGIFAKQALTVFTWPEPDDAEVNKIFNRMIDSVALGQLDSKTAIKEAAGEVNNLIESRK